MMSERAPEASIRCRICDGMLESTKELSFHICLECRRYGLLNGHWPNGRTKLQDTAPATVHS